MIVVYVAALATGLAFVILKQPFSLLEGGISWSHRRALRADPGPPSLRQRGGAGPRSTAMVRSGRAHIGFHCAGGGRLARTAEPPRTAGRRGGRQHGLHTALPHDRRGAAARPPERTHAGENIHRLRVRRPGVGHLSGGDTGLGSQAGRLIPADDPGTLHVGHGNRRHRLCARPRPLHELGHPLRLRGPAGPGRGLAYLWKPVDEGNPDGRAPPPARPSPCARRWGW